MLWQVLEALAGVVLVSNEIKNKGIIKFFPGILGPLQRVNTHDSMYMFTRVLSL